eukprot:TRINITY_DN103871_c0_g1_i1.p1 TRINITY_DN103871_c0_g1~~TRINITY_DN103871_c0_g1_i1.p1  ORF type:complete len:220 (+),score=24.46 TRINITY_DN103871_c0_g1_i1:75-662(+)
MADSVSLSSGARFHHHAVANQKHCPWMPALHSSLPGGVYTMRGDLARGEPRPPLLGGSFVTKENHAGFPNRPNPPVNVGLTEVNEHLAHYSPLFRRLDEKTERRRGGPGGLQLTVTQPTTQHLTAGGRLAASTPELLNFDSEAPYGATTPLNRRSMKNYLKKVQSSPWYAGPPTEPGSATARSTSSLSAASAVRR